MCTHEIIGPLETENITTETKTLTNDLEDKVEESSRRKKIQKMEIGERGKSL